MNKSTVFLSILVVLNLVLLATGINGKGDVVRETVQDKVRDNIGAVSSPDIMSPYFSFGGVRQWASSDTALTDASSTVCALVSPAATSTLVAGSVKFTTAATSSQTVTIGKGETAFAITTMLATSSVAANEQATVLAATTTPVSDSTNGRRALTNTIFSPNTYMIVTLSSANAYTDVEGDCQALWVEN